MPPGLMWITPGMIYDELIYELIKILALGNYSQILGP